MDDFITSGHESSCADCYDLTVFAFGYKSIILSVMESTRPIVAPYLGTAPLCWVMFYGHQPLAILKGFLFFQRLHPIMGTAGQRDGMTGESWRGAFH